MTSGKPMVSSVCVYCGSQVGDATLYRDSAARLGAALARARVRLVYGGGSIGLMGVCADAALASGGAVTGVIPRFLATKEVAHAGLADLVLVDSMHERKRVMFDRSDAFVALPGGYGTLDELFEMVTWRQLGRHEKPILLVNLGGFYDHLVAHVDRAIEAGFVAPRLRALLAVARDVDEALKQLGIPSA